MKEKVSGVKHSFTAGRSDCRIRKAAKTRQMAGKQVMV